jgi:hypothetical protein
MTGPEHYAEAERLLTLASEDLTNPMSPAWTHLAQIHATLASAAATITAGGGTAPETGTAWRHVVEPR